jgi:hypothetical protein
MHAAPFHGASVGLHLLSALVVYSILRHLSGSDVASCIGALLFALHPIQVETVAWASGAKDLLGGLLALVSIQQYLCVIRASPRSGRRVFHYSVCAVALVAGMLAKPIAVVAPAIAIILDIAFLRRQPREVIRSAWPLLVLTIPCIIWSRAVQEVWPQTVTPLWSRPLIAGDALAFYLGKLVWPMPLSSFYARTPQAVLQSKLVYVSWIAPIAVLALAALSRERRWELLGTFCIFVAALLPVLGFMPFMYQLHSTVAEHYMYLPMFGVAVAGAVAVAARPTRAVIVVCCIVLALLDAV